MTSIPRCGMIALLATSGLVGGFYTPGLLAQVTSPSSIPTFDPAAVETVFGQSLVLRTDRIVADSTHTAYCWLGQTSPVAYASKGALKLKFTLLTAEGKPKLVKDL